MDPERPGSAPQLCTLQPSSEPAGSISPQPPLDLSGFPLAKPWDVLSPDAPADAAPDFVHPLVTAVHLDPGAPWLMSRINPAGSTPTPPLLDPAGFPLPELWTGPHMDAPPDAAPDPALPPVAAACLDPADLPPTSMTNPAGSTPTPPPLDSAGFPSPELWTGPHMDAPPDAAPDPALPPVAAACLDPADVPPTSMTNPDLGEVLAHVSHTLRCHPKGMRVKPLTKRLRKEHGVDLLAFSQDGGYQGVVSFLQEMPGIELWNPEKGEKCRVLSCTFKKNVTDPLPLLCSTLGSFPNGLRVFSLRKAMWQRHGVNLEEFSQQQGYLSTLDYLTRLRGIRLQGLERGEKCLVQLQKGDAVTPPAPQPPPDPAPPSAQPSSSPPPDVPADGGPTGAPGETPGLAEVSSWVRDVLGRFPLGLKVGKLKEALRSERGLDLEELSRQRGCGDALHLLRALPHLWLRDPGQGDACLARLDVGLAEVSSWVRDVLGCFPLGLKVGKLKKTLRSGHGLDLEELSRQRGCGDALHLLRALPHVWLRDPGKGDACLARLDAGDAVKPPAPQPPPDPAPPSARPSSSPPPDAPADGGPTGAPGETPGLAEVSAWVRDVLGRFPLGLKVGKLKEALRSERGLDLEELSRQRGCGDALHLLRALPHIWLQDQGKGDACLARLDADAAVNAPALPAPSHPAKAGGPGAAGPAKRTQGQRRVAKPGAMEALIRGALAPYPFGMRVKNLRKLLVGKHGAELEAFSQARGYGDVVSFLRDVPGLTLRGPEKGNNCIVWLQRGATEVLTLLKCLLRPYKSGLQLQKLQELLLERHGLDLKRFVSSQGEEDVLGFLQRRLPALEYRQPEKGAKCIVWLGTGQKKGSGSLPPGSARPLPGSKRCLLPTNAAERLPQPATACLNPRLPSATTNRPLLPSLPSAREPFRAPAAQGKLGKSPGANPRLPAWLLSPPRPTGTCSGLRTEEGTHESGTRPASAPLVLRAEEGTQEFGTRPASAPLVLRAEEGTQEFGARPASAPLVLQAEEGTQESRAQPPEDLRELKRKVGAILAGHPGGMSLFQFRAAYSAAHQHPLPLGCTASTKQRLAQMPDVVRMQGCGVQMLLLPVDPDEPPGAEPGLALWIPQEAAALAGDTDDPSEPLPTLAEIPPVPAAPDLTGDPDTPAEPPPTLPEIPPVLTAPDLTGDPDTPSEPPSFPAAPDLTGDPDTPAEPPPTLPEIPPVLTAPDLTGDPDTPSEPPSFPAAPDLTGDPDSAAELPTTLPEIPPVLTAPDPAGDPKVPVKPPPTLVAPRWGPSLQAMQRPEAARPEPSWELPDLVPSAPVVLPASGPGSRSWLWLGAESPPAPADPGAAARPVVYPPPREVPTGPAAAPESPSLCPVAPGPPQARLKRVQLVPPFQDHPWAGDASRAQPVPKAVGQNQGTSAAVGSPVGPIPADPSTGQAVSPIKQLSGVAPDPLPPPEASVSATPERGWPDTGRPGSGGDIGSPVDPFLRCHPAQPVPSAGTTQPGPWAGIPSAPPAHSPPHHTDTCILL
ncbi:uncharacterized protein LOC128826743 isoform X2 [Malaclemys terrapin pileata]|uniref:uncharacterized protein LOC128826743 isoform X2 n=1 Tax=Malaclemys terrapin pileata TaxID=2991368 RepID=UPI0023A7E02D|nr:uncharacterized protein LOC128826743 isoform X2 [Malaclemys terrapin pileata]